MKTLTILVIALLVAGCGGHSIGRGPDGHGTATTGGH